MKKIESKHDRFVRLAESRVNRAIKAIELIGNLSNQTHYNYSQNEVRKIFRQLNASIDAAQKKFTDKTKHAFKL